MIGSGTLTRTVAGYLARTGYDALNNEALRSTKEHILSTLGTVVAGSSAPGVNEVLTAARMFGGNRESTVLVYGEKLSAPSAALVNATMAHSRELDVNDDRIAYKSSVAVIPALLAVAEKIGRVSGRDFLTAVCLGVDFGIRLGLAINPKPAHAQAIALGPLAAAAACGKILRLDEAGLWNALGIAYCRVSFTGNSTVSPSLSKRLGVGFASQSGVFASLLASVGFPAAGEILQGKGGFFQTFYGQEGDYEVILDELGSRFEIVSVGPKPFPSCRYTHPAVTAVLDLLREHPVNVDAIREIRVHMGERDMRGVGGWTDEEKKKKHRPDGVVDAQFSIPFTVAAALVRRRLSLEEFTSDALRSDSILTVASRVSPILDRTLDDWPADVKPQIVEIETNDRQVFTKRIDYPKGNPLNPITSEELVDSFRDMANYSATPLDRTKVDETIETILGLEKIEDVSVVARLLTA